MGDTTQRPADTETRSAAGAAPDGRDPTEVLRRRRDRALTVARFALPALLAVFIVFFSIMRPDTFATFGTLRTILTTQSVLAVLALAALVPLVIGTFDLSIGAILGLAAILVPGLPARQGVPLALAVVLALLAASAVGLINGWLVGRVRLNSFIATIGMSAIVGALVLAFSGGAVIFQNVPPGLRSIAQTELAGLPLPIYYVAVVATVLWFVLEHTPLGRHMAAVGGSAEAARLSGVNVATVTLVGFVAAGLLAGIAGVIQAGQLGTGNPAVGPPLLLPAFAAAFLGSTSIKVGRFNVWGTMFAVVTIATGLTGLELMGVPQWVQPLFNGLALIVAVATTRYLQHDT